MRRNAYGFDQHSQWEKDAKLYLQINIEYNMMIWEDLIAERYFMRFGKLID